MLQFSESGRERLRKDIKRGCFVPFLGAGASSLRPHYSDLEVYPWKQVAENLRQVYADLTKQSDGKFLSRLASERLGLGDLDLERISPLDSASLASNDPKGKEFVKFQAALVRAAAGLTQYFGTQLVAQPGALTTLGRLEVPFDDAHLEAHSSLLDILEALEMALEFSREGPIKPRLAIDSQAGFQATLRRLEMRPVYLKLLSLVRGLLPLDDAKSQEFLRSHRPGLEALPAALANPGNGRPSLPLASLQWLLHLIWYTFRFWIPRHPTTSELALEISLYASGTTSASLDLAKVAQDVEYMDSLSQRLTEILEISDVPDPIVGSGSPNARSLHLAIATVMHLQFEMHSRFQQAITSDPMKRWRDGPVPFEESPLPIALTTNYDRMLERALEEVGRPYHVLFPVNLSHTFRDTVPSWRLRSFGIRPDCHWVDHSLEDVVGSSGLLRAHLFQGPLIVKLHGSPLEVLPMDAKRHLIVMSESSYLEALGDRLRLPQWVVMELSQSAIWMLGYSLSDLHVRLWLTGLTGPRLLLRDSEDPGAGLHYLNIETIHGDLRDLAPLIFEIASDREIELPEYLLQAAARAAGEV